MAIAGLVLAILAAITSFIPIVNNLSFVVAILSLVLAIIGMVGISRGKHSGKGIAIAGIVISVLSIVIVLGTQSIYSDAVDEAFEGPQAQSSSSAQDSSSSDASSAESDESQPAQQDTDFSNLSVGDSVTLDNGLVVSVDSVQTGLANFDGSEVTGVTVTYTNNGDANASFNSYDWKAEDASGAQRDTTIYTEGDDDLSYGELSPGGTVTGSVYFDGSISKVHYYSNVLSDSSSAAWSVA